MGSIFAGDTPASTENAHTEQSEPDDGLVRR